MRLALISALALAACASSPNAVTNAPVLAAAPVVSPAAVIAAERAFAARAGVIGWAPAFREFSTAEARMGAPGYPNAQATLPTGADGESRDLFWWPAYAGIARSGDLGFTTGPVSFDEARTPQGHYFTVWRRQPDGRWKWVYDGGVGPINEANLIAPDAPDVATLAIAQAGGASAENAAAEIGAIERAAASGSLAAQLAPEAQIFRSRHARGIGETAAASMGVPAADVAYEPVQIEASAAGDLVAVIGDARWTADGVNRQGLYARVWQRRSEGWRIVYDQLAILRPPPPPG